MSTKIDFSTATLEPENEQCKPFELLTKIEYEQYKQQKKDLFFFSTDLYKLTDNEELD